MVTSFPLIFDRFNIKHPDSLHSYSMINIFYTCRHFIYYRLEVVATVFYYVYILRYVHRVVKQLSKEDL